jgi:hypothetical protein
MCLIIDKEAKKKYTWFKTITVYKVLEYRPISLSSKLRTPYRQFDVELGKCYTSELIMWEGKKVDRVERGLHSITNLEDAKKLLNELGWGANELCIVKCVIPKFSKYYEGKFNDINVTVNSIASSKLIYLNII